MLNTKHIPPTNGVLRALPSKASQRLLAQSEQVNLTYGDILCEPGKPIRHIYFINSGLISLLTSVGGRDTTVEVGLVGKEGVAGLPLVLGVSISPVRMLVQGSGTATRMKATSFRNELKRSPELQRRLNQYLYTFMAQVAQTAACNSHHLLVKRLARWLLMAHDRVDSNEFRLTQEFLAHMLGVRRVGVNAAAKALQKKKLISYHRGNITVLNRKGLERASFRDRMLDEAGDRPIS